MSLQYSVAYTAENVYESTVEGAFWQFLILPEENRTQELIDWEFKNSVGAASELSINGLGFETFRVRSELPFQKISFSAKFKLVKQDVNPFSFILNNNPADDYKKIKELDFRVDHEPYLRKTWFTKLPKKHHQIFMFNTSVIVFENLKSLNTWVFEQLFFKPEVTDVSTRLQEIIEKRHGVCQDFTHLFCAIARENGIPARYVSGYLHQGNGYFGDSQMHAWAEAFVPNVGWVGFDPTNNILAGSDHIKVAHGKDYNDCSPLKGIVYGKGTNQTSHSVKVQESQQQ